MQNPRTISDLLRGGKTLSQLRQRAADRARVLDHVKSVLPARLALEVLTAGMDGERLTVGVSAAVWASRLRFHAAELQEGVSAALGSPVTAVRIRIVHLSP
jgi:hypothetical protein